MPNPQKKTKKRDRSLSSSVYNMKGSKTSDIELSKSVFGGEINIPLLHQAMLMYQANKRSGTASTKDRSEVRGGGKKPWRQKGTGRARVSSIRNPIWRGGGVAFGPRPRDYSFSLPAKMKKLALKSCLSSKLEEGQVVVIDKIELDQPKTKLFKAVLDSLKVKGGALVILNKIDDNVKKASRNIPSVTVRTLKDFNMMDVLGHESVVITEPALKNLTKRLA